METVTISSKYQVVIPRAVRDSLGLHPGQKVAVIVSDGKIEFIPVRPAKELRGILKGLAAHFEREDDRI